jgi:hypothetical protein
MTQYLPLRRAGKLANGWERGKGSITHAVPQERALYGGSALCGIRPAISWTGNAMPDCVGWRDAALREEITCPKCRRMLK